MNLQTVLLKKTFWLLCLPVVACSSMPKSSLLYQPSPSQAKQPANVSPANSIGTDSDSHQIQNPKLAQSAEKNSAEIVKVQLNKQSKNSLCKIDISYPQIKNLANRNIMVKINNYLKAQFLQSDIDYLQPFDVEQCATKVKKDYQGQNAYSEVGDYAVGLNRNNILSVRYDGRLGILQHAAHPTKMEKAFTLNLQNGKVYSYENLFNPNSNYSIRINNLIYQKLAKQPQGLDLARSFNTNKKNKYSFLIDKDSLVIIEIFDSYALQSVTVSIKPAEIADIINPQGPLSVFLN